jgi:Fic family protein
MRFYLEGLAWVATQATDTVGKLLRMFEEDRRAVLAIRGGSIYQQAAAQSNLLVYDHFRSRAMLRIPEAAESLGMSKPTVARAVADLEGIGIVREITGRSRNRLYVYQKYVDAMNDAEN